MAKRNNASKKWWPTLASTAAALLSLIIGLRHDQAASKQRFVPHHETTQPEDSRVPSNPKERLFQILEEYPELKVSKKLIEDLNQGRLKIYFVNSESIPASFFVQDGICPHTKNPEETTAVIQINPHDLFYAESAAMAGVLEHEYTHYEQWQRAVDKNEKISFCQSNLKPSCTYLLPHELEAYHVECEAARANNLPLLDLCRVSEAQFAHEYYDMNKRMLPVDHRLRQCLPVWELMLTEQ